MLRMTALLFLCLCCVVVSAAQDRCDALTLEAIESAQAACPESLPGLVCYASGSLEYTSDQEADEAPRFTEPGDILRTDELTELRGLSDEAALSLAIIYPRANLVDSALTMLLVGDVTLHNSSPNSSAFIALPVTVRAVEGANVRARPDADATRTGQLTSGQNTTAIGRTRDNQWILVLEGWVSASLLTPANWSLLEVAPAAVDITMRQDIYSPMQRFDFISGMGDAPCAKGADSGLIMQTPELTDLIPLAVNSLDLQFAGTLWLQAAGGELFISILEGALAVGNERYIPGQRIQFSQSNQLKSIEDYHYIRARWLPLALLPREITLSFSLGGLLSPISSPEVLFETVTRDSPCTIAWGTDINLRAGPGTEYPIRRGVAANYRARPDAYATGTDSIIWWRLAEDIWIRSGIVVAAGRCLELPTAPLPPLP